MPREHIIVPTDLESPLVRGRRRGTVGANNQYGTQWSLLTTDNPRTVVNITDDDNLAGGFTLTLLAPPVLNWGGFPGSPRGRANIRWGNGGALAQAAVDIHHGIALSLNGTSVYVEVQNISFLTAAPDVALVFGAFVSYGARSNHVLPTFTNFYDAGLAPGAIENTGIIPAYARRVALFRRSAPGIDIQPVSYTLNPPAGALGGGYGWLLPFGQQGQWLEVPPGTIGSIIQNTGAAAISNMSEIFELAL